MCPRISTPPQQINSHRGNYHDHDAHMCKDTCANMHTNTHRQILKFVEVRLRGLHTFTSNLLLAFVLRNIHLCSHLLLSWHSDNSLCREGLNHKNDNSCRQPSLSLWSSLVLTRYLIGCWCLQDRLAEHKYAIQSGNVNYSMAQHFLEHHKSNPSTLQAFGIDHISLSTGKGDRQSKLNQRDAFGFLKNRPLDIQTWMRSWI